jgi:hypothetical protein
MDLGSGLSPEDPRWNRRLSWSTDALLTEHQMTDPRPCFENESVQAKCPDAVSEEEMYCRKCLFLQNQAYRTPLTRIQYTIWCLHGEARGDGSSRCVVSQDNGI